MEPERPPYPNGPPPPADDAEAPGHTDEPVHSAEDVAEALEELRRLLIAPEQSSLHAVQERLDRLSQREDQIERVSDVLPDAVIEAALRSHRFAEALAPTVEETLRVSVESNPKPLVDAIFPIIGPAIRKAIAEALRSFIETINKTMEHSLSPRSFRWRIEAARTGRSFSEVVLSHTLLYRVEQIFLIHRHTGLPLHHVTADAVEAQDGSLVSGMLTALQDFVNDSFGREQGEVLDAIEMGDVIVWIEEGPDALVAAVIRGVPAPGLRDALKEIIENIHLRFRHELDNFEGENEPFGSTRPLLEEGLLSQFRQPQKKTLWGAWIAGAVVGVLLGTWLFFSIRAEVRWSAFVDALDAEPGLVVTNTGSTGDWSVHGLRDPFAADPAALLAATQLDPGDVTMVWEPYQALAPEIMVRRAARLLDAPASVAFSFTEDGTLAATGTAPIGWLARARAESRFLPGVLAFDATGLAPDTRELDARAEALGQSTLRFQVGTPRLVPGQNAALDALATAVQALAAEAARGDLRVRLQILGHASAEGDPVFNQRVSLQRAEAVRTALLARGLLPDAIEAIGTGQPRIPNAATTADREANRSVSFRAVVE